MSELFTLNIFYAVCALVALLAALVWIRRRLFAVGIRKGMEDMHESTLGFVGHKSLAFVPLFILGFTDAVWALMFLVPICSTLVLAIKVKTHKEPKPMTAQESINDALGIR
jgi:hypothetical protein